MTDKALLTRVVIETLAVLVTCIPLIYWYVVNGGDVEPFARGFFCDDENLKHPYSEEQISVGLCAFIWIAAAIFIVTLVETLSTLTYDFPQWSEALKNRGALKTLKIPRVVIEIYRYLKFMKFQFSKIEFCFDFRILGYFAIGALFCTLTTEIAKYNIGRLRPYFLTVCNPDLSESLCKDANGYEKFVTDYQCHPDADEKMVREARKSFLSGHSSFSFYSGTFIILYLHARLSSDMKVSSSNGKR